MKEKIRLNTPLTEEKVKGLKAGDQVLLSGFIYTARDAAHKRLQETLLLGEKLPFDVKDQIIYYVGPSPDQPGRVIGAAGPTTSYRMDVYTPALLEQGLKGMIGKGNRNKLVIETMIKNHCVYFAAIGGAGALMASAVVSSTVIAYEDLGTEAIRRLEVSNLPVIVAIDSHGNNLYEIEIEKYKGR